MRGYLNERKTIGTEPEGTILPGCDNQGEREGNDDQGGSGSDENKLL